MAWQGYGPVGSTCAVAWISLRGDNRLQTLRYLDFRQIAIFDDDND